MKMLVKMLVILMVILMEYMKDMPMVELKVLKKVTVLEQ